MGSSPDPRDELPLRPGVARGARPERRPQPLPAIGRAAHTLAGVAGAARRAKRAEVTAFAQRVARAAKGLEDLDEAGLDEQVAQLRLRLRRSGLEDELLVHGFALVREAARRTLGTPHYDVQLFGGWIMIHRGLAELETGEGKTLTATLPACVAALAGIPVHIITANDYLVERDAQQMTPVYECLGLRVGCVLECAPEPEARRAAYACDVTYVTNKQVAFDYLRDRIANPVSRQLASQLGVAPSTSQVACEAPLLRGLCFAVADEADSVLIDDAGTPLILSRPGAPVDEQVVRTALSMARGLQEGVDFRLDRRRGELEILDAGRLQLEKQAPTEGQLLGPRRREEWIHRALHALHLIEQDRHYVVRDERVEIIDLPTGRRSPDRAFEGNLQALIEAKLGLELTPQRETIARTSYQRFFRSYLMLGGMTGTAREVARELWDIYGLRTVSVPTRLPSQRRNLGERVFPTLDAKWDAAVARIGELHAAGRPVLVGTCTVESSEALSGRLDAAGLPHQVLNARQDEEEAAIVANAGEAGRITVATQMAGRGTDIALGPGVPEAGGLAVLATELGDARRIDRQLCGRCGRQGGQGSFEQLASAEDRLLRAHLPRLLTRWLGQADPGLGSGAPWRLWLTRRAQSAEERRSALTRRRLMDGERLLDQLLAFSKRRE